SSSPAGWSRRTPFPTFRAPTRGPGRGCSTIFWSGIPPRSSWARAGSRCERWTSATCATTSPGCASPSSRRAGRGSRRPPSWSGSCCSSGRASATGRDSRCGRGGTSKPWSARSAVRSRRLAPDPLPLGLEKQKVDAPAALTGRDLDGESGRVTRIRGRDAGRGPAEQEVRRRGRVEGQGEASVRVGLGPGRARDLGRARNGADADPGDGARSRIQHSSLDDRARVVMVDAGGRRRLGRRRAADSGEEDEESGYAKIQIATSKGDPMAGPEEPTSVSPEKSQADG